MREAAEVALSTVLEKVPRLESVELVRFMLDGQRALDLHEQVLRELLDQD